MTETFEVGQTVQYGGEDVTVTYGPYTSPLGFTRYVVKLPGGAESNVRDVQLESIPEPPAFTVGDKVKVDALPNGQIVSGPYKNRWNAGETLWVVEGDDGLHSMPAERRLTKIATPEPIKVGDRVRVVRDDSEGDTGKFVGRIGVLKRIDSDRLKYLVRFGSGTGRHGDADNGQWYCEAVERVTDENTYTHNGVTYDLTAKYQEPDGTVWSFTGRRNSEGVPTVTCYNNLDNTDTIATIADDYALTRVTA